MLVFFRRCLLFFFMLSIVVVAGAASFQRIANLPPVLLESSGLVWLKGRLWTMVDERDPRLYALSPRTGKVVKTVLLKGVINRDWEAIAIDQRYFYVGDIGDNAGHRKELIIYRFPLSKLSGKRVVVRDKIQFQYPSDRTKSNLLGFHDADAEAMAVVGKHIFVFSKNRRGGNTTLFRLPNVPGRYVAKKIKTLKLVGLVTAVTHTLTHFWLLSYRIPIFGFHVYLSQGRVRVLNSAMTSSLSSRYLKLHCQAEGLAIHQNAVWITCEGNRGRQPARLYRLPFSSIF